MLFSKVLVRDLIGSRTRLAAGAAALVILLAGCGGGGGDDAGTTPATPQVSGKVFAPGGMLAFNAPTGIRRFFAEFFGSNAVAALPGVPPVAGATVRLIEINSAGSQIGAVIASAVTAADGSFTLNAPAGFTPAPRYVVRAIGTTADLDRLVTDLSTQDVDPATHVTKSLVLARLLAVGGNIQNLSRLQVDGIGIVVATLVDNVGSVSLATTAALVTALNAEASKNEALTNAVANLTATSSIAGTVTDSGAAPLAGIRIWAYDDAGFERSRTTTDASGQYSLNLAPGDYIVGAINFTAASTAASEWWTCNDVPAGPACGVATPLTAGRVTVVGATPIPVNFKLEPGARVEGSVTSAANAAVLPGVQVLVRDFTTNYPAASQRAQADGTFRINVRPGDYFILARNRTLLLPYAGGVYNGPAAGGSATTGGGATLSDATRVTLAAGSAYTVNLPLVEGGLVSGLVTDGATPTPNPVNGAVRFYLTTPQDTGAAVDTAIRTDLSGVYRLWVRPGIYSVRSRSQFATPTVVAFSSNNNPPAVNFGLAVGRATATFRRAGNVPLANVRVSVYDSTASAVFKNFDVSDLDGTVEIYAEPTGTYRIEYSVQDGWTTVGSAIHDGTANPTQNELLLGALVTFDTAAVAPTAIGTMTMPAGGELKGVVTTAGAPARNHGVQVRSVGVTGTDRFTTVRTRSDGSYNVSLPAGTYGRVCAFVIGSTNFCSVATPTLTGQWASVDNVVVTGNQSYTLNIAIPGP